MKMRCGLPFVPSTSRGKQRTAVFLATTSSIETPVLLAATKQDVELQTPTY